jgi:hypothetical protein
MANLITLAEYKESEGIQSPKEDLRLSSLIPSVSQLVKTYCGNSLVDYFATNKTETFNITWNTYAVQLTETPVNTVVSVKERSSYGSSYETLTTTDYQYYFDYSTDSILRTNQGGYMFWPHGPASVEVVYKAGYETCPADLRLAVIDLITYYLKDEHKERRTLGGATIQNQTSSSQRDNVAFPDHIKRVLDLYKNF